VLAECTIFEPETWRYNCKTTTST